jgi:hypothetical protein
MSVKVVCRARKDGAMAKHGFIERNPEEAAAYLSDELANGVSRLEVIEAMEDLLPFTKRAAYEWDEDFEALIYATTARSGRTFDGVCQLLRAGLAVQAAMLTRTLFEDMVVGHWVFYNHDDHEWLVQKFLRQREAIALHQRRLQREAGFSMGPPISVPDDAPSSSKELIEEFGGEVHRDWWNPGREGGGKGLISAFTTQLSDYRSRQPASVSLKCLRTRCSSLLGTQPGYTRNRCICSTT